MYRILLSAWLSVFPAFAAAAATSVLTVPIDIPLSEIEARLDRDLPRVLVDETRTQTCVEAEEACTKIPEFRGFRIYSRMECVQVTPPIGCTFTQTARRDGPLRLSASGPTLVLRQHISGHARVRGRGDIGRHISQSASAAGEFTIRANPGIASDWTPVIDRLSHDVRWTRTPSARLFNLFRITFRGEAERALSRAMTRFREDKLPEELARLGLRAEAARVWSELQAPLEVDLPGHRALWIHFRPQTVGIEPLRFDGGRMRTRLSIAGRARATDSAASPFEGGKAPLPDLTPPPADDGVAIELPIDLGLEKFEDVLGADLPQTLALKAPLSGSLTVLSGRLSASDGALVARLEVRADVGNFPVYEGPMTVTGTPRWNAEAEVLSLAEPRLVLDREGLVETMLQLVLDNGAVQRWLADRAQIGLGDEIARAENRIREAIARPRVSGFRFEGEVDLSATGLAVEARRIRVTLRAEGRLAVIGLSPR